MPIIIPGISGNNIDALYVEGLNAKPEMYPLFNKVFSVEGSDSGAKSVLMSPDVPLLNTRATVVAPVEDTAIGTGWTQTFTHAERARKVSIPYAAASDQPSLVGSYARLLGIRTMDTVEALLCGVLANAFTTTLTARPEVLCAVNHALNSGGTASNRLALALSHNNMATARSLMMFTATDAGAVASYPMAFLIVPKELAETAYQIQNASSTSDQLQPTSYQGRFEIAPLQFTGDVNDWFIAADKGSQSLTCVLREAPKFWNRWVEDTMTWDEYAYVRLSQGVIDWRGVVGSIV